RKRPGVCRTASTVPLTGRRLTCTSSGDMRMLTRVAGARRKVSSRSGTTATGRRAATPTTATAPSTAPTVAITGQPSRAMGRRSPTRDGLLVAGAIDQPVLPEPRHEGAQARSDLLDRMLRRLLTQLAEVGRSAAVLRDP